MRNPKIIVLYIFNTQRKKGEGVTIILEGEGGGRLRLKKKGNPIKQVLILEYLMFEALPVGTRLTNTSLR